MSRPMPSAATVSRLTTRRPESAHFGDVCLALGVAVLGLPSVLTIRSTHNYVALGLLFDVGLCLPLVWRRRWPMQAFAVVAAVAFVQWLTNDRYLADVALLVAFYTVAAREDLRRTAAAAAVLELGIALATIRWVGGHNGLLFFVLLSGMTTAAYFIGTTTRTRRAYLASVEDRAARLELERDQQAQLAAAAERARIARDMHDIVAHHLSVMIALAEGAAFTTADDPARAAAVMRQVSATGRQALNEMRRLLGVLREDLPAALEPQPGLVDLDQLLAPVRLVGLRGELVTEGQLPPLSAGLQLTVYRLVQEALTNTLKHAVDAKSATVSLRFADNRLEVEIVDDGVASRSGPVGIDGHGINGMRERASMYGGTIEAGPRGGRGWRVGGQFDLGTNTP